MRKFVRVSDEQGMQDAFDIRRKVFIVEQGVSEEEEMDEHDAHAEHVLVYNGDDEKPAGTGRMRVVDGIAKMERICVLPSHRGLGLGQTVMEALEAAARNKGLSKAKLHSQTHAEQFYSKLGYETVSGIFHEADIPHVAMVKKL